MEQNNLIEVELLTPTEATFADNVVHSEQNTPIITQPKSKKKLIVILSIVLVTAIGLGLDAWFIFGKHLSYYEELEQLPTLDSFDKQFVLSDKEVNEVGATTYSYKFSNSLEFEKYSVEYCKTLVDKGLVLYYNPVNGTLTDGKIAPGYFIFYDSRLLTVIDFKTESSTVNVRIPVLNSDADELTESEMDELSEGIFKKEAKTN